MAGVSCTGLPFFNAVLRQLGHLGNEALMVDDAELDCHQQLQNLYNSTRTAKHFQRDIVRGVEGFMSTSKKQMEIGRRLAEDCCKYGTQNQNVGSALARAALHFGTSHSSIENERETMLGILGDQVPEPLRTSITGAPLEDARHLTYRYGRLRQELEAQVAEVIRRQSKSRDPSASAESSIKLQHAETRLNELKSSMMALGRVATDAMLSVEAQQQRITFQKLRTMVGVERSWHQTVVTTLEKLHAEMILEKQLQESSSPPVNMQRDLHVPGSSEESTNGSNDHGHTNQDNAFFIAKVIHNFDAQEEGELSLSLNDHVVVRQVAPIGWSEGESNGKAGWFPSAYVERQERAPVSKISEISSLP